MSAPAAAPRFSDFDVERDYERLRAPLLGLLLRDGWRISDEEWDAAWNAVCASVWHRQQRSEIDFRGEPLNYLLTAAKNELRRERSHLRPDVVSLDADDAPEPASMAAEPEEELDLRDKLRVARTIARHRLRPRELRVWGLRVVCGLTYEQGAARLGMTPKRFEKDLLSAHARIADEIRAVASGTWCDSTKGVSLLRAYEQGVLDPDGDALRELREHSRGCPACRRAMKEVEGIVPLLLPPAPFLLAATAPGGDGAAAIAASSGPEADHADRSAHVFGGLRRAAVELWHAIAGTPASAGAVQASGEGATAAGASGVGLLGVVGGKAIAACLTAGALGTCLTVVAAEPPSSAKHHRGHRVEHRAKRSHAATAAAATRPAGPAPLAVAPPPVRPTSRAPSLARAAKRGAKRARLFSRPSGQSAQSRAAQPSAAATAPGGEFDQSGFESQSGGGGSGSAASSSSGGGSSGGGSSGSGGGSSGGGSAGKPPGGEFASGGFEK